MPTNLGYMEEFDVAISIEDKDIREKANYVTYVDYCGLVNWYDKGLVKEGSDDMSPNYGHEGSIDLKAVILSPARQGKNCTITFKLFYVKLLGPEVPKDFVGHTRAVWKDGKATYYQNDELAVVKKDYRVHPTEVVVNLPSGYNFRTENTYPFIGSAYSIHEQGKCESNECFMQYGIYYGEFFKGYFGKEDYEGTKSVKEVFDADMDKRGDYWKVPTETLDAGVLKSLGASEGYYRKRTEINKGYTTFESVKLETEFIVYKKNHYLYYRSSWSKNVPKGEGDASVASQLEIEKKTLASIMFRPHIDDPLASTEPEKPVEKTVKIEGAVRDKDNKTMPYIEVNVVAAKNNVTVLSDKDGRYSVSLTKIRFLPNKNSVPANITTTLTYKRDGKNYFVLNWNNNPIYNQKKFEVMNDSATQVQDIILDGHASPDESTNLPNLGYFHHFSVIYTNTAHVTDFALTELGANIDYKLPVEVLPCTSAGTLYRLGTSVVEINVTDCTYDSSNKPDNREYHEFCHHIMFSQWNGDNIRFPGDKNHAGYINNNTADSYTEGFAEFCAMAASRYMGDPKPELYADFGSFEYNYKAWSYRGAYEEIAIAGILWDLYDDKNDAMDTVSLPLKDIWGVLRVKRTDFFEYYKAFKAAFPEKSDSIDKVFISHGFFADKHAGNKSWDREEPFKDANSNGRYDAGEHFVDYGQIEGLARPWMQYEPGYVVGPATNYERENRHQAVRLQDAYIKAADAGVSTYTITVSPKDSADGPSFEYQTNAVNGLIYVAPLPEDMDAEITIEPGSEGYSQGKEYRITNKEYVSKYYSKSKGQAYIESFDFQVKSTGTKGDEPEIEGQKTTMRPGPAGEELFDDSTEEAPATRGKASDTALPESPAVEGSGGLMGILLAVLGIGILGLGAIVLVFVALIIKKRRKK